MKVAKKRRVLLWACVELDSPKHTWRRVMFSRIRTTRPRRYKYWGDR